MPESPPENSAKAAAEQRGSDHVAKLAAREERARIVSDVRAEAQRYEDSVVRASWIGVSHFIESGSA